MDPLLQRHCGIADLDSWRRRWPIGGVAGVAVAGVAVHPSLLEQVALPMLARLRGLVQQGGRPVLALNGPVGAGKSSLARALVALAPGFGLQLGVASIDDFYLPWEQRRRVMAGNPFGVTRVPPGSHDLPQLERSLQAWQRGGVWDRPRFDKRLRGGQGDRAGFIRSRCEALVLEGWLMGCRSLGPALENAMETALQDATPALTPPERRWLAHWDRELRLYDPLWARLTEIWVLRPGSWNWPRRWRFQAEARQRRSLRRAQDPASTTAGGWLPGLELDRLVRASLCSLPPVLYQDPLGRRPRNAVPAQEGPAGPGAVVAVATLDSRRRCLQCLAVPGAATAAAGL